MRLIPLMLAALVLALPASAAELTGTLQKIKETGTITLGVRDSSVPFSYLDDNRSPSAMPSTSACGSSTP